MSSTSLTNPRSILAVWMVCACVLIGRAQQDPVFQSNVVLVPLNVHVLDADGHPVSGLSAADFTITENGIQQNVSLFRPYTLEADADSPSVSSTLQPRRHIAPSALAIQKYRVFLIVLGSGRLNEPSKGPESVARFVREKLLPQDRVAILAWGNRATDFTTHHEEVARILDRFKAAHEAVETGASLRRRDLGVTEGEPDARLTSSQLIDWVFAGAASKPVQTALAARDAAGKPNRGLDEFVADDRRQMAAQAQTRGPEQERSIAGQESREGRSSWDLQRSDIILPFDRYAEVFRQNATDLSRILTGIEYLRHVEGEKHLIFMSEQPIYLDRLESDLGIAAVASDAQIVLDMVQTGGVPGPPLARSVAEGFNSPADKAGPTLAQVQALTNFTLLAELTGGVSSTTAHVGRAASRIDQASRSGYLLGYYPANTIWNGAYRRIAVKVNRKNATALFRHGYYATGGVVSVERRAFFAFNRIAAAVATPSAIRGIQMSIESAVVGKNDKGVLEAAVSLRLDLSAVPFEAEGERQTAFLDIGLFCGDSKDRLVGQIWQKADLALKPDNLQRLLREGLRLTLHVPLSSPSDTVKVVAYSYAADRVGSATAKTQMSR